jgi:putative tricarboxylic transport membrane protein
MNRFRFIGSILIILLLGVMFWLSLPFAPRDALWPQGLILVLFLLCLKYMVGRIKEGKVAETHPPESGAGKFRVWGTILLIVGYLFLSDWAGYYVSTVVFLLVALVALGERSWVVLSVLPLATTFVIYLVFYLFLRIPLPTGTFF